ncbi:hypothetical protein SDC9_140139 [bioreactor metagenome]|uniref:Uncharacterized protein n=1 Tax=bioreactor metagenome TaxID=1076179 RepID=A0A645DWL8_9ZZZZ
MKHHLHAQRLGQHRQLCADGAIAHDAQRLAARLERAFGALAPAAAMHRRILGRYATQQQNGLAQHQLSHRACIGIRRIEHRHAMIARGLQIDLVGADAKRPHRHQLVGLGEHVGRELRARTDAQEMHVGQALHQFIPGERPLHRFDLRIARSVQHIQRAGVDAFQQQEFELALV